MRITTNNHWRAFKYVYEVPPDVLQDYDHLEKDEKHDNLIEAGHMRYAEGHEPARIVLVDLKAEAGVSAMAVWMQVFPREIERKPETGLLPQPLQPFGPAGQCGGEKKDDHRQDDLHTH